MILTPVSSDRSKLAIALPWFIVASMLPTTKDTFSEFRTTARVIMSWKKDDFTAIFECINLYHVSGFKGVASILPVVRPCNTLLNSCSSSMNRRTLSGKYWRFGYTK